MKLKFYGTRGSIAISRLDSVRYGGNTTCLRVSSQCIPERGALIVDAGTGFRQLSKDLLLESVMHLDVLYTHYHADHTGGILLAPHAFIPSASLSLWGPTEHGIGPEQMMLDIMRPPHFPVHFKKVAHRFDCRALEHIGTEVLVVHPKAGMHLLCTHVFERLVAKKKQLPLGEQRYPVEACLVIRMHISHHPEYTVSYRFEEMPTGRVFVFLTDHENTYGLPGELLKHVRGANLLVQDCQYSAGMYHERCAGFGHGTPDYCARVAEAAGVQAVGITHHDPDATDEDVDKRLEELKACLRDAGKPELADGAFACHDYMEVEF